MKTTSSWFRHPGSPDPPLILVATVAVALPACGGLEAGSPGPSFEEHRVSVGVETSDVLALDVDRDGRPEAVTAGGGVIVVLARDGEGSFRIAERVPGGENPTGLASGDLDGDGWADLVVANHETDYVTLLFGGPEGFGARAPERIVVGVSPHPHAVRVADLDGDGRADFLVDDRRAHSLLWFRGRGDGTFRDGEPIPVGGDPYRGMAVADLDLDGDQDLVTPNPRRVAIQLGDGHGGFTPGPELEAPGVSPFGVAVGDVNGDGLPDLAAGGGEGESTLALWLGSGEGTFTLEPGSPHRIPRGPAKVGAADVNEDGVDDILVASWSGGAVTVIFGGREERRPVRVRVEGNPWGVAAADFDGDGRTDLVVGNGGSTEVSFLMARGHGPTPDASER